LNLAEMSFISGLVSADEDLFRIFKFRGIDQSIFGKINKNRSGSSASSYIESLFQNSCQVLDILHKVVMLRARSCNANDIGLLKSIVSDQKRGDLAGHDHKRDRVHKGCGNSCNGIRRPWARGDQYHPHLSRRPGISVGRMDRSLLVSD
jgi:hypothetical protein